MEAQDIKSFIQIISKEKDLDRDVVKNAIQEALVAASKKNLSQFLDARVELDAETGQMRLYVHKLVVDVANNTRTQISLKEAAKHRPGVQVGETVEVEIDPSALGRIAALNAKQVVMQKLREAERMKIHDEYAPKLNTALSAVVMKQERRDFIVMLGRTEAVLPGNEVPFGKRYRENERIKVFLYDIDLEARGPILKVSRNHPHLVSRLFEQEVPEISDGTVKIVNVVREPGSRTKIAVQSISDDVDPIGACVGVKGSRVQMIVRELENEKIDIVPFTTNTKQYITNALVPAQISSITLNEETHQAEVIVKSGNLSLAIGKKGQNAKLAARLTEWKLDIHSEGEEAKLASANPEEVQRKYLEDFLSQMEHIDQESRDAIFYSEYNQVAKIANADLHQFATLLSGDLALAEDFIGAARDYTAALAEMTRSEYGDDPVLPTDDGDGEASDFNAAAEPNSAIEAEPATETEAALATGKVTAADSAPGEDGSEDIAAEPTSDDSTAESTEGAETSQQGQPEEESRDDNSSESEQPAMNGDETPSGKSE